MHCSNIVFGYDSLPFEIQLKIIENFSNVDLPTIASACKQWNSFYIRGKADNYRLITYEDSCKHMHKETEVLGSCLGLGLAGIPFLFTAAMIFLYGTMNECPPCAISASIIATTGVVAICFAVLVCREISYTRRQFRQLKHKFHEI
jgi:hypothetical protein